VPPLSRPSFRSSPLKPPRIQSRYDSAFGSAVEVTHTPEGTRKPLRDTRIC